MLKDKILTELSANRDFYKPLIHADYSFDVKVDGMKYEISPCLLTGYWNGGEAHANFKYESEMPFFTYEELTNI